jgi:hypothetical protein
MTSYLFHACQQRAREDRKRKRLVFEPDELVEKEVLFRENKRHNASRNVKEMEGYNRLQKVYQLITKMETVGRIKFKPEQNQIFHITSFAALRYFFEEDWQISREAIVHTLYPEYENDKDVWNVMFNLPRQTGKSTCIGAYVAALVLSKAEGKILVTAHNKSRAEDLLGLIKGSICAMIKDDPSSPKFVINKTDKLVMSNGTVVTCVPATDQAIRGNSASLIICDEFDYIKFKVFIEAMLPILRNNNILVGLSTANPKQSGMYNRYASEWDKFKAFTIFNKVANMCDNCIRNKAEECTHMESLVGMGDIKREKELKAFYPPNSLDIFRRELHGSIENDQMFVFERAMIDRVFKKENNYMAEYMREDYRYVYAFVDPSGGGNLSHTAVVFFVINAQGYIVVSGVGVFLLFA